MSARGITCYTVRVVVKMPGHPPVPLSMTIARRSPDEAERAAAVIVSECYRDAECREVTAAVAHASAIHATGTDLTPADIQGIRDATATQRTIGRRFGVSARMVREIRAGRTWKEVA